MTPARIAEHIWIRENAVTAETIRSTKTCFKGTEKIMKEKKEQEVKTDVNII